MCLQTELFFNVPPEGVQLLPSPAPRCPCLSQLPACPQRLFRDTRGHEQTRLWGYCHYPAIQQQPGAGSSHRLRHDPRCTGTANHTHTERHREASSPHWGCGSAAFHQNLRDTRCTRSHTGPDTHVLTACALRAAEGSSSGPFTVERTRRNLRYFTVRAGNSERSSRKEDKAFQGQAAQTQGCVPRHSGDRRAACSSSLLGLGGHQRATAQAGNSPKKSKEYGSLPPKKSLNTSSGFRNVKPNSLNGLSK